MKRLLIGVAAPGAARPSWAWHGEARLGAAWRGSARRGVAGLGMAGQGKEQKEGNMETETEKNGKRPIALLSIDAKLLYERLIQVEVGAEITNKELSDIIGRNVQESGRGVLATARRKAQREDQIVFGIVRNVGLKRLTDAEIVNSGERSIEHHRRSSKRAGRRLTCVQHFDALPPEVQTRHNAQASYFGLVAHLSTTRQMKRLEEKVSNGVLPLQRTLEAFKDT
jgi:hypothetical protein